MRFHQIESKYDEFEESNSHVLTGNQIENSFNWDLNFTTFITKAGYKTHSFWISYFGNDFMNIVNKQTIKFLLDGIHFDLPSDDNASCNVMDDGSISEQIFVNVTQEQLETILNAKDIKLRIYAATPHDFVLTELTLEGIREFYIKHIK